MHISFSICLARCLFEGSPINEDAISGGGPIDFFYFIGLILVLLAFNISLNKIFNLHNFESNKSNFFDKFLLNCGLFVENFFVNNSLLKFAD